MRAATTKILCEKTYLKTLNRMYDFIFSEWFIYKNFIWWEWEKKPRNV